MVPVRVRALALAASLGAAGAVVGSLLTGPLAHAETSTDARARAAVLATKVHDLQVETELATEHYDASAAQLQDAVGAHLQAEQAAAAAAKAAAGPRAAAQQQVRALYENGGPLVEYATFLRAGGPEDLVTSFQGNRNQAAQNQQVTDRAVTAERDANARLAAAAATARQVTALNADAQSHAATVTTLLAQQTALLKAADDDVKRLAAEEEKQRVLKAQLAFLAAWQKARAKAAENASLIGLPGMGTSPGTADLSVLTASDPSLAALISSARDPQVVADITAQAQQAANPVAQAALLASLTHLGAPYLWGGTGPTRFDCSGLTGAAYAAAGLTLPRTAAQQYQSGPHPSLADLRPGDLLFWADDPKNPATIHHVALYAGGNLMVSTDHTGDVARVQPIWADGFAGATRPDPTLAAAVPGPVWSAGRT